MNCYLSIQKLIHAQTHMKINEYFDKVYCINLDKRKDRWLEIQEEFQKNEIEVERFSAIEGNPMGWKHVLEDQGKLNHIKKQSFIGAAGCMASHVNLWKTAKKNGYDNILIVEDDCIFRENLQQLFSQRISEVPNNWDLLYFGGVHKTCNGKYLPESVSDYVLKCARMITTTCYAIKSSCYDLAIDTVLENEPVFHAVVDGYLAAYIQPKCNAYAFAPPFAWQRAGYSDIQGGRRDYKWMKENNTRP